VSKRGLGRGFDSLIPTELLDESFDPTAEQDDQVSDLRQIKLSEIQPDSDQPRHTFDDELLQELAKSIAQHGVLQPIVVRPHKGGYMVVAGERRWRASVIAGLDKIPALVRTLSDQHKLEISLIENLQRADLNPLETATAYVKLRDQFNLTLDQVGDRLGGKSKSAISNTMRLLRLPDFVRQEILAGKLGEGQARTLVGLDSELLKEIVPRIIKESWSVHAVEQYLVQLKRAHKDGVGSVKTSKDIQEKPYVSEADRIHRHFKAPVEIKASARGNGQIIIRFKNEREFHRIFTLIDK